MNNNQLAEVAKILGVSEDSISAMNDNQQGELFRQLALAMPSGDQKCPSQPSEPAERKTRNRQPDQRAKK